MMKVRFFYKSKDYVVFTASGYPLLQRALTIAVTQPAMSRITEAGNLQTTNHKPQTINYL